MKISEYIWKYSERRQMTLARIWLEVLELVEAIQLRNWAGIKEEMGDVVHFFQVWLFWTLALDQQIWWFTRPAANKFMARHEVWSRIYVAAGLRPDMAGSMANYRRPEKIVDRLLSFGVEKTKAEAVAKQFAQ